MTDDENNKVILFQNKGIRRTWFKEDWYYSVVDIVGVLTDSVNPRYYWYKTKKRLGDEEKAELSTIWIQLKLEDISKLNGLLPAPLHSSRIIHIR